MKIVFSEASPDYDHYVFPYVVWGFPEGSETPADFFERGFLPSSANLDRFYLCRGVRVHLPQFKPSSENRRILRKGLRFTATIVPRASYNYTVDRRAFFKRYADERFGADKMTFDRLDKLMSSPIVSHLAVFEDAQTGNDAGTVMLYLEQNRVAYYYFAFYDMQFYAANLGMYMMTWAAQEFAARGFERLYLGSCYSRNALYKFQFSGCQFFTGFDWSDQVAALKFRIDRDEQETHCHLFESSEYLRLTGVAGPNDLAAKSLFQIRTSARERSS